MTEQLWSARAEAYRDAAEQREGADLDLLVSWAEGETALDVATGGGHVARRLREAGMQVVSADPAPGMAADVLCRAEDLPFADASFDTVVTRIAPHHFDDVEAAVAELARVARRVVLVEDTLFVDEDVERAERLRDPTHVRSYTEDEWRVFFAAAGLGLEAVEVVEKRRPLDTWLARTQTPPDGAAEVTRLLAAHVEDGDYVDRKILLRGRKPGAGEA